MNEQPGCHPAQLPGKPYWLYLLECSDGSFYCGIALDVQVRFVQHLAGSGAAYARSHKPLHVMASRQYPSRSEALRAEIQVKRLPKRSKLVFSELQKLFQPTPPMRLRVARLLTRSRRGLLFLALFRPNEHHKMNSSQAFVLVLTAIGHISFALTFLSYAQRDIIKLRMIAVASLLCGLVYNGWVQSRMTGDGDIWLVIFWLSVFLVQNIFLLVREIRYGLEVTLPADSRALLVNAFPSMHSRDWKALTDQADVQTFSRGSVVLDVGQSTTSLKLIIAGVAKEHRGSASRNCEKGTLWGELTFVMGSDQFNASPVKITAESETLVVYAWDYSTLKKLAERNLRMAASLNHGFVCSAGIKHGLLWVKAQED